MHQPTDRVITLILPGLHILPAGPADLSIPWWKGPFRVNVRAVDYASLSEVPSEVIVKSGFKDIQHAARHMNCVAPYDSVLTSLVSLIQMTYVQEF